MTTQEILARLEGVKEASTGWMARCPAHKDKTPSLSINVGSKNKTLLNCHAGCLTKNVVAAMGLKESDLFSEPAPHGGNGKSQKSSGLGREVATYNYRDEIGAELFRVIRYEPKTFRPHRPDPDNEGRWIAGLAETRRVLYRLPELIAARDAGETIFIVEGEKDVETLVAAGLAATTSSGGAAAKWLPSYTESLRGAKRAVVIADKDTAENNYVGQKHAAEVAKAIAGAVEQVQVFECPDRGSAKVKDATDWFEAGGCIDELLALIDMPPEPTSSPALDAEPLLAAPPVPESDADAFARRARSVFADTLAALDLSPAHSKTIFLNARDAIDLMFQEQVLRKLPATDDAFSLLESPTPVPAELVKGILHLSGKMVVGGGSKSFKTWTLLDLAICVSHGIPWLGHPTSQAPVLFVNLELPKWSITRRISTILQAKALSISPGQLVTWNLRGIPADYRELLPVIAKEAPANGFGLVILDPAYRLLGGADENSARDIGSLLHSIGRLADDIGAAIAFGAHYAKGNASAKEAIDRISGSGVFARDPDSILTFTKHEEEDAYSVEATLRDFPPLPPFVVRWHHPVFQRDDALDPADLKQAVVGRKRSLQPLDILAFISESSLENPISISAWADLANVSRPTLHRYVAELRPKGWIKTVGDGPKARQFITQDGLDALAKIQAF